MKFPVIVRHRREKATIYGKSANYAFYRLGYYVAGQRRVRSFKTYGEAKTEAERIVRQLAEGSQAAAFSGAQSRDALAAMERLTHFYRHPPGGACHCWPPFPNLRRHPPSCKGATWAKSWKAI